MNTENSIPCKRIIHLTYELYPQNLGGIGVIVYSLVNQIAKLRPQMQFEILLPYNKDDFENKFETQNVKILCIKDCYNKDYKLNFQDFCKKIKQYLDENDGRNSIIHVHDITLLHMISRYKNVVYTFHKDDGMKIMESRKINSCIFFTKYSKRIHKIPADKYYIIPNAMCLSIPQNAHIAFIGRTSNEKGFDKYLEYVESSNLNNKYFFVGTNDFVHPNIENKGVLDNKEVNNFLTTIDYLFVPSEKEEFGLIILEAINKGVHVFVNSLPQLKELYTLSNQITFINFSKRNFISRIDNYINKNFYKQKEFLKQFEISSVAKKYLNVYDKI